MKMVKLEYMYSVYKSTNNKLERRYHIVISAVIPVLWGILAERHSEKMG